MAGSSSSPTAGTCRSRAPRIVPCESSIRSWTRWRLALNIGHEEPLARAVSLSERDWRCFLDGNSSQLVSQFHPADRSVQDMVHPRLCVIRFSWHGKEANLSAATSVNTSDDLLFLPSLFPSRIHGSTREPSPGRPGPWMTYESGTVSPERAFGASTRARRSIVRESPERDPTHE